MRARKLAIVIVVALAIVANIAWLITGVTIAAAQDVAPVPSVQLVPPEGLRRGQAAPRDGLFVEVATYLAMVREIEGLEARIGELLQRERARCDALLGVEHARLAAAEDRLTLRDGLWRERQGELIQRVAEEHEAGQRDWYEEPLLWFAMGGALVGVIVGIVAAALN
jgi:hypothetical protein